MDSKWLSLIFCIIFSLKSNLICQKLSLNINNSSSLVYEMNDTSGCNTLFSSNVDNNLKCLMLCQTTRCSSLTFDKDTNNCTIIDPKPNLIKYDSIPNLNLAYQLCSKFFLFFNHTISKILFRFFILKLLF